MRDQRRTEDRSGAAPPRVPSDTQVYAIGDIHGCIAPLTRLITRIETHAAQSNGRKNVLIFLGDYVDRGPDSRAVVEFLIRKRLPGFDVWHLKGNHEDMMLTFLEDGQMGDVWMANGARDTFESYGVDPVDVIANRDDPGRLRALLAARVPPDHLDFLRGLRMSYDVGDYHFVHAGIRPGIARDAQRPADQMWIRDVFLDAEDHHGAVVVHGHSISYVPEVLHNRIGIDTGAFLTGTLTCLVLEEDRRTFLST